MADMPPSSTSEKIKNEAKNIGSDLKNEIKKIPPTTDRNLMAALSYVWGLSIVMLVIKRNSPFIQFHAKQGIVLMIISILWFIAVIGWLIGFLAFIGMFVGFMNAWQGKEFQIPVVYRWSQKVHL